MTDDTARVKPGDGEEPRLLLPTEVVNWLEGRPAVPLWNGYKCESCGKVIITIDVHRGVTPFTLACRVNTAFCKGTMKSFGYPKDGVPPPEEFQQRYKDRVWHWYRPNQAEFIALDFGSMDHVMRGGLLIKKGELL